MLLSLGHRGSCTSHYPILDHKLSRSLFPLRLLAQERHIGPRHVYLSPLPFRFCSVCCSELLALWPHFFLPRVMSGEGVFSGDWQRRQARRLDNTARQLRAPESASGSGCASSAAPSDWHPEETVQAEFGRMRLAAAQPASFSPERYVQYIRGRPVVVLMLHIQTHGFGSACDIIHMTTVGLYTACMRLIYLGTTLYTCIVHTMSNAT